MKTSAIILHAHGDEKILQWQEVPLPPPQDHEVQIAHHAIGINFIEIYYRSGLYPLHFPSGLGTEAAGVVQAVGSAVSDFALGDRVAYCTGAMTPIGAYSQARNIPADVLVKLPNTVDLTTAAAVMLKGLTAQYLLRQTHKLQAGETILIYAASGGVGQIAVQWAKHLGARVIGIVGSSAKAAVAENAGCDHLIIGYDNIPAQVRSLTQGRGVDVVYDSVGGDTFLASLECLRPRGLMVSYGNASGAVAPFSPNLLAQKGSLFLTRPTLFGYANTPTALRAMANELFHHMANGHLRLLQCRTLPFSAVQTAHRELASRQTTGATVLIPD